MEMLSENYKEFLGDGSTDANGKTLEEFLKEYDPYKYKNPAVTADIVVMKESSRDNECNGNTGLELLLIKRMNHPCINSWALPGGFAEEGESLADSAKRELFEETGVHGVPVIQLQTWGEPDRDPRGRVITVSYLAYLEEEVEVIAGDDAKEAIWVTVSNQLLYTSFEGEDEDKKQCKYYKLSLENEGLGIHLEATVKVSKNVRQRFVQKEYEILDQTGIAFDHAKIIVDALLKQQF